MDVGGSTKKLSIIKKSQAEYSKIKEAVQKENDIVIVNVETKDEDDLLSDVSLKSLSEKVRQKSFNNINLINLGIDSKADYQLLPHLNSVFSSIPLLSKTYYPNPISYDTNYDINIYQKIHMNTFKETTLLYIFYTTTDKDLQRETAKVLTERGYKYENRNGKYVWITKSGSEFDQWGT